MGNKCCATDTKPEDDAGVQQSDHQNNMLHLRPRKEDGVNPTLEEQLKERDKEIWTLVKYIETVDQIMFPLNKHVECIVNRESFSRRILTSLRQTVQINERDQQTQAANSAIRQSNDGFSVWDGRILGERRHGPGVLTIKDGKTEVKKIDTRYICGDQDGYRITSEYVPQQKHVPHLRTRWRRSGWNQLRC